MHCCNAMYIHAMTMKDFKMTKHIKLTSFGLLSALLIVIATPLTAQAGTLTIFNKNCTKTADFATKKRVAVHVDTKRGYYGCTDIYTTVHKGHSKTIQLAEQADEGQDCGNYRHEAAGTIKGKFDVPADGDSHVTCKKDWLNVCQCTKD